MDLNDQQQRVVDHPGGPLLVLACPGSGKTRCIISRISAVIERGARPSSILAVTFTNKAADEMKERLHKTVDGEVLITTFHSLCVKILRKCGHLIGYKQTFTICDDSTQLSLLRKIVKNRGLDPSDDQYDPKRLIKIIEDQKNQLIPDDEFERDLSSDLVEIFREYRKTLKMSNSMDFGDLICKTIELFRTQPKIEQAYSAKFKHVLVDEMQDTNKSQLELVKRLASVHRNIIVVGDADQMIYGWRGACLDNILQFERHFPEAQVAYLGKNYRCTPEILAIAESLINRNRNRRAIKLEAIRKSGEPIKVIDHGTPEEEAEEIASYINMYNYDGMDYSRMAILCRTNSLTRAFEECFRRRNIPYILIGAFGFYDRKEVKQAISFMKFLANPEDALSFEEIVNTPSRGIGPATVVKILEHAEKEKTPFIEVCRNIDGVKGVTSKAKNAIAHFMQVMDTFNANDPCKTLTNIFEDCGFLPNLRATDRANREHREDNVLELMRGFAHYCKRKANPSLDQYLQEVMLISAADNKPDADAVNLMTAHAAKGLEFDVVFIPGMEEGIFPHKRSIAENSLEEERRVAYVAVTRAKSYLYLSRARIRGATGGGMTGTIPSRFLEDMGLMKIDWNAVEI